MFRGIGGQVARRWRRRSGRRSPAGCAGGSSQLVRRRLAGGSHDAWDGVDGVLADRKELFGPVISIGSTHVSGSSSTGRRRQDRRMPRARSRFGEHEQGRCGAAVVRDLDRAARARRPRAVHDGVLRRTRAARRALIAGPAQAREVVLQAGVDLGPGDDCQPVGQRRRAAARQDNFDQRSRPKTTGAGWQMMRRRRARRANVEAMSVPDRAVQQSIGEHAMDRRASVLQG